MREHIIKKIRSAFPAAKDLTWPQVKEIVLAGKGGFSSDRAAKEWFYKRKKSILNTASSIPVKIADNSLAEYNKDADQYAFFPEQDSGLVGTFVISGGKIRSIIKNYSNVTGKSETTTKISQSFGIPRRAVVHILKALNVKHDSLPWTNEELSEKSDDELVTDYVEQRNFQVGQKIARKNYELIKKDADDWNAFKLGNLDPLEIALKSFTAKDNGGKIVPLKKTKGKKVLLLGLTDTHIGDIFKDAFAGVEFNSEISKKKIEKFAMLVLEKNEKILDEISHCEILSLGDTINSCLDGLTRKGTHLRNDLINEELFDFALSIILNFVKSIEYIFKKVKVRSVKGNHCSYAGYCLMRAVEQYFSNNKNVTFDISKEFIQKFTVNNALILCSHGGHDTMKFGLPPPGPKLDSYVHTVMLDNREAVAKIRRCYVLSGHKHSLVQTHTEKSHYEFFIMSASVPATEHSSTIGFRNISRHQGILLEENGDIAAIQHYYL